jgi:class 3 adenylate cyclase
MINYTLKRCRSEKRYSFAYYIFAVFTFTLGYFIEMTCGNVDGAVIGVKILYAGGVFLGPFFFFFVAEYCEIRIPKLLYQIPILIIPVLFYLALLTFDQNNLTYLSFYYNSEKVIPGLVAELTPLYLVGTNYPVVCLVLSDIILIRRIITYNRRQRFAFILLLVISIAPAAGHMAYEILSYFSYNIFGHINFTFLLLVIANFVFFYNVMRSDLFDLGPKALAITLDLIRDIFIVLDQNMIYRGSNNKATELFPALTEYYKGSSILKLENWPQELSLAEIDTDKLSSGNVLNEIDFSLSNKPGRHYSGWMNHVASKSGVTLGWIILIQDVTERVRMTNELKYFNDQLRNAFSKYLSEEIVEEIASDPTRLQLGGTKRYMTAMFTDIKSFTSIAEVLAPEQLVGLLNYYLSSMSDIILEQKGTIDKYEGDAIMAFFGAPNKLPDHALRTCTAAVLIKRLEYEINKQIAGRGLSPQPIHTRIGINTGEMVVGNMGTSKKMNYTVIGNAVNLASRLEGVNKQFETWIIASENTVKETADKLLFRKLGWIRVVGINKPVRIYEILELYADAPQALHTLVELFHIGLNLFETGKWKEAETAFNRVLELFPEDGPSLLYLNRCKLFFENPPANDWDGVFDMREK